jgi:hypothetical protein
MGGWHAHNFEDLLSTWNNLRVGMAILHWLVSGVVKWVDFGGNGHFDDGDGGESSEERVGLRAWKHEANP